MVRLPVPVCEFHEINDFDFVIIIGSLNTERCMTFPGKISMDLLQQFTRALKQRQIHVS